MSASKEKGVVPSVVKKPISQRMIKYLSDDEFIQAVADPCERPCRHKIECPQSYFDWLPTEIKLKMIHRNVLEEWRFYVKTKLCPEIRSLPVCNWTGFAVLTREQLGTRYVHSLRKITSQGGLRYRLRFILRQKKILPVAKPTWYITEELPISCYRCNGYWMIEPDFTNPQTHEEMEANVGVLQRINFHYYQKWVHC